MDMRRYHYTDIDPASGKQVFPGFAPPTTLYPDNGGKIVQRIRPRYNSEYVWNVPALDADRRARRSTTTRSRSGSLNRDHEP